MSESDDATVTGPAATRYLGWYQEKSTWKVASCSRSNEFYTESGTWWGCPDIYTECVTDKEPTDTRNTKIRYGCTGSSETCMTQVIHSTYPAPAPDPSQKIRMACLSPNNVKRELYRANPTEPVTTTPTSSPAITNSQMPGSSPTVPTVSVSTIAAASSPTSSTTNSPQNENAKSTSPGVIAGATLGGVALLLVLAFLIYYFAFRRRKQNNQVSEAPAYPSPQWVPGAVAYKRENMSEAPSPMGRSEVNSGDLVEVHGEDARAIWAHENTHEVGELPADKSSRFTNEKRI